MPTYQPADAKTNGTISRVMHKFHGALEDAELTVQCLFAYPNRDDTGEVTAPAVVCNGYPAYATIQILNHKRRAGGNSDVELILDWDHWSESTARQQEALVDHELTHIELKTDEEGGVIRDAGERPMLKMRKHDRNFGWFDSAARHYGEDSIEVQQAREMIDSIEFKQAYLFPVEGPASDAPLDGESSDDQDASNVHPLGGPIVSSGAVPAAVTFTGPDFDRLHDAAEQFHDAAEQFIGGTRNGTLRGRGKKA